MAAGFAATWLRDLSRRFQRPSLLETLVGFVTNFFDTLGIGSFAPTTSIFRLKRLVPDEEIPGTLNVGHTLPVVVQAFIFVTIVQVDTTTLMVLIAASILGSVLGAGVVTRLPRRKIQLGMGIGLLAASVLYTLNNLDAMRGTPLFPGVDAIGLEPTLLAIAAVISFVLGALLTLGIGYYAPCMIMVSLMGMTPRAAFPIMMGACAVLMPIASARFVRALRYAPGPALGLTLGGIPAVLIAAYIVKELPLTWVRWLVVIVVLYAAQGLIRAGIREGLPAAGPPPAA